jgi:hypothetical protein
MKKVVSDRRASLDEETEVKPATRKLVENEFLRGASILRADPDQPGKAIIITSDRQFSTTVETLRLLFD